MNTFGFEIVLPIPMLSSAVISAFKTPEPVLLKIPIPLVAPVTGKLDNVSETLPSAAPSPGTVPSSLPELVPATPPATFPALL